jgi:hypothetical protein
LRLLSAVLFAGMAGLVAATLSVSAFDAIPARSWTVAGLVALPALACGAASALALRLLGAVGTFVATAVLLTVGAATSTGSFPAEYLPGWLAPLADVLPPGVAVQALRGTAYLSGADVARGVVVLVLWSAVPFVVVGAVDAISRRRSS